MSSIPLAKSAVQLTLTSALSAYGLLLSYQNITRLQQYEKQSEKAAEWSNTAADKLHKTRTTQASGTISVILPLTVLTSHRLPYLATVQMLTIVFVQLLLSLLSPIILLSTSHCSNPNALMTVSAANTAILLFARNHMGAFWNEKEQTRVPFVQKFNEAIKGSEQVVGVLSTLSAVWGVAGVVWGLMGREWL